MHPRCCRPATGRQHRGCIIPQAVTQSSAREDGQNNCPKHVELTGIINKSLLLHLVGCLYYLYQWCTVKQISVNEIYFLIKYTKRVLWRVKKRLSYIEDARCLKVKLVQNLEIFYTKANVSISDIWHVVSWNRLETVKLCCQILPRHSTRLNCVISECLVQRCLRVKKGKNFVRHPLD